MKGLLIPLAFLSLVNLVVSEGCGITAAGTNSNVICVSKTQYVFPWQNLTATPHNCTNGTVCANVAVICSNSSEPLCKNTIQGSSGTCNDCIDEKANPVCISDTTYSVCNQGIVLENLVYTCPPSTPYCKALFNLEGTDPEVLSICQKFPWDLDCSGGNGTTTVPPTTPPNGTCTKEGFFADPSSADCTRYFKCQANTIYDQLTFTCSIAGQKFNPSTVKCESNYTCP